MRPELLSAIGRFIYYCIWPRIKLPVIHQNEISFKWGINMVIEVHWMLSYHNDLIIFLLLSSIIDDFHNTEFLVASSALPRTDFSSDFPVSFRAHWFANMRQTGVNIRSLFILSSLAQLPMLYSDSWLCLCSILFLSILNSYADPLVRPQEIAGCPEKYSETLLWDALLFTVIMTLLFSS